MYLSEKLTDEQYKMTKTWYEGEPTTQSHETRDNNHIISEKLRETNHNVI